LVATLTLPKMTYHAQTQYMHIWLSYTSSSSVESFTMLVSTSIPKILSKMSLVFAYWPESKLKVLEFF